MRENQFECSPETTESVCSALGFKLAKLWEMFVLNIVYIVPINLLKQAAPNKIPRLCLNFNFFTHKTMHET